MKRILVPLDMGPHPKWKVSAVLEEKDVYQRAVHQTVTPGAWPVPRGAITVYRKLMYIDVVEIECGGTTFEWVVPLAGKYYVPTGCKRPNLHMVTFKGKTPKTFRPHKHEHIVAHIRRQIDTVVPAYINILS